MEGFYSQFLSINSDNIPISATKKGNKMSAKKSIKTTPVAKSAVKTAVKKAATKKAPAAKKAPAVADAIKEEKKCACSCSTSSVTKSAGGLTRIIVKFDAGWGNNLYIRGNGAGLSWQKGVLMQCTDSDEWIWENKIAKGSIEYKILINDEIWAIGEDMLVNAGETVTARPCFCGQ